MRTIPIKLLNSLIKIAQRKHKIPKSSSFPKVFFQNFEVDQTLKSKYSQSGILDVEKVVDEDTLKEEKSAVDFHRVFICLREIKPLRLAHPEYFFNVRFLRKR